jgi:methionyl aminopeptidase
MEKEVLKNYEKAMKIAADVVEYSMKMNFKDNKILNIAEEIENVTRSLGGKPAWPVNININEIAAHYTPDVNDAIILKEGDMVKVDIGVHVNGYIADRAFTVCVGRSTHPLIEASEKALKESMKLIKPGTKICEISEVVEDTVNSFGFNTIRNLCGHAIERFNQHAHPSIPNGKNTIKEEIQSGQVIAMEVFTTNGSGLVAESSPTIIFKYKQDKPVRMFEARRILDMAKHNFEMLPFTKRWVKEISPIKFDMAINQLVNVGALYDYPPLKEEANGLVAQTEETIIVK